MSENKRAVELTFRHKLQDGTVMDFEVMDEVAELFKCKALETRTSESWKDAEGKPLHFYFIPTLQEDMRYQDLLTRFNLRDDYGSALISRGGRFNIAFLRTEERKGTISVPDTIGRAELQEVALSVSNFLKLYFEERASSFTIRASVSLESIA